MPTPTPEPPVKRYGWSWDDDLEADPDGDWCKWSEVEALLLQRAQEIAELQAEQRQYDRMRAAYMAKTNQELTARAQEIEQVKAENRALTIAEYERHAPDCTGWQANCLDLNLCNCKARKADAALVSRAPQPEQKPDWRELHLREVQLQPRELAARLIDEIPTYLGIPPTPWPVTAREAASTDAGLNGLAKFRDQFVGRVALFISSHLAAPLPASAALQALIKKWRVEAEYQGSEAERQGGIAFRTGKAQQLVFLKCADDLAELAAALSRTDQP